MEQVEAVRANSLTTSRTRGPEESSDRDIKHKPRASFLMVLELHNALWKIKLEGRLEVTFLITNYCHMTPCLLLQEAALCSHRGQSRACLVVSLAIK